MLCQLSYVLFLIKLLAHVPDAKGMVAPSFGSRTLGLKTFIGVDTGASGAIGVIHAGGQLAAYDMPRGKDRSADVPALCNILAPLLALHPIIAVEWNTSRPHDAPEHALRFGLVMGAVDAVIGSLYRPPLHISPTAWKPYLGLVGKIHDPTSWQGAELFEKHYPDFRHLIYGPRGGIHDGPLDALLIAHYLKLIDTSPVGRKGGKRLPRFRGLVDRPDTIN